MILDTDIWSSNKQSQILNRALIERYILQSLAMSSKVQQRPEEFLPFRHLPKELRLRIYNLSIQPRVITIKIPKVVGARQIANIPALLHVSQEARSEALRTYTLLLGTAAAPAKIYVSLKLDTIYIPGNCDTNYDKMSFEYLHNIIPLQTMHLVKHLALDCLSGSGSSGRLHEIFSQLLLVSHFETLEELTFIYGRYDGEWQRAGSVSSYPRQRVVARGTDHRTVESSAIRYERRYIRFCHKAVARYGELLRHVIEPRTLELPVVKFVRTQ